MSQETKNIVIMNFSGVYESIHLKGENLQRIECRDIEGTNCYCDDEAIQTIKERLLPFKETRIHFIDSGNYHYMTRIWTDFIKDDFDLIVFDNHTDMQPPAFGGLLSCGGWIASVLSENPHLHRVILIGPSEEDYQTVDEDLKQRVLFISREMLSAARTDKTDFSRILESYMESLFQEKKSSDRLLPVYLSIDKDILNKNEIQTNWSQGDMTFTELHLMLQTVLDRLIKENRKLLGLDICGEGEEYSSNSEEINKALLEQVVKSFTGQP